MEMNEKIKQLRLSRGMTQQQLADALDIKSYTTITKWEKGENVPQGRDLIKLSKLFNASVDDILGINIVNNDTNKYTYYPTAISAGLPLTVDGITEASKISISDEVLGKYANDRDIFFVRANGDSMNNLFDDGALLAVKEVDSQKSLKNGDIVIYACDGEYSVKHFYKTPTSIIFKPNSTNNEHHEHHYSLEDEIKIHGKVVTYIVNVD